jgi:hypothetical protein
MTLHQNTETEFFFKMHTQMPGIIIQIDAPRSQRFMHMHAQQLCCTISDIEIQLHVGLSPKKNAHRVHSCSFVFQDTPRHFFVSGHGSPAKVPPRVVFRTDSMRFSFCQFL